MGTDRSRTRLTLFVTYDAEGMLREKGVCTRVVSGVHRVLGGLH
jgi:hypothetical protein